MDKKRAISGVLLSFAFLAIFAYMVFETSWVLDNATKKEFLGSISDAVQPSIGANSAISLQSDLAGSRRLLFSKNNNIILPIASLTKLMTAVIVLDNYDLASWISVSKKADSMNPIFPDVKIGDKMTTEAFLQIMLVGSSNRSAYALAEKIGEEKFVGLMNQKAKEIGLLNTSFSDPTGLSSQNVSSAGDLAMLTEYILKNYSMIAEISRIKQLHVFGLGDIENTDQLIGEVPGIVCSKTGFTSEANGCLLVAIYNEKSNDYLINVVLGAQDRFSEMEKIIGWSGLIYR